MTAPRTSTLHIRTPEGVVFTLSLAGPVTRFLGWLVDAGVILVLGITVSMALALVGWINPDLTQALLVLSWFVIQIGYGVVLEWWWRGQTPGKRLLRLRVVDAAGFRLGFNQVLVRNLLRFVDFLPGAYLVGGAAMLLSRRSQRLGDLAANTVVIRQPQLRAPAWDQLETGKYNSMLQLAHLAARLRQRASPEAARLALQALLRRQQLEPAARLELFREVAAHFRSLTTWPPEAVEGLSDEQFVRNTVEILFRRDRGSADAGGDPGG